MAKQIKIKDIAIRAGVSVGTVDRVIHNRGKVSQKNKEIIEKVLQEVGYKSNIHASAISLKKSFRIIIITPTPNDGEYWSSTYKGFNHALEEYYDIQIECLFHTYNQFDVDSSRKTFEQVMAAECDAVIIAPTFEEECLNLCNTLDERKIPYIFVDSMIENANPIATYMTDQNACGHMVGRLLDILTPKDSGLAIMETHRMGNKSSKNTTERKKGFYEYIQKADDRKIKEIEFTTMYPEENEKTIISFLKENPDIKGIAIMNSRSYIVAEILAANGINDISIVSFDLTSQNAKMLEQGYISFLLCQHPELQGFSAIEHMIEYLLYKKEKYSSGSTIPIDIIMKENLPFYKNNI